MKTENQINVLGISGSLRQNSLNTATLLAACELVPQEMVIHLADLSAIPLFNQDLQDKGFPLSVEKLRRGIQEADAVLIATPEYNYSIPGVLKNAIDWASRPPHQVFSGKPIGIIGASPSQFGTVRAQYHLRQILVGLNGLVMNQPEVFISHADQKFDHEGLLIDLETRRFLQRFLGCFKDWVLRMQFKRVPECWGWVD